MYDVVGVGFGPANLSLAVALTGWTGASPPTRRAGTASAATTGWSPPRI
ncbi:SidA/IucD/PvdA family monooxygenase [Streptomyces cupreus]